MMDVLNDGCFLKGSGKYHFLFVLKYLKRNCSLINETKIGFSLLFIIIMFTISMKFMYFLYKKSREMKSYKTDLCM